MRIAFRQALLATMAGLLLAAFLGTAASGANAPDSRARLAEYPLRVIAFETAPKRPRAGRLFVAVAGILNEETGEPVTGELRCPARIGHRSVRVAFRRLEDGVAGCGWTIPARTRGKRFVASMVVLSVEGYEASVPISRLIRH